MTITGEFNLSASKLDALKEIASVGAGNAATALSRLVQRRIDMNVPRVDLVHISDVPDLFGGADTIVAGIFLRVYGKAPSNILFMLPVESALALVDAMMGQERGTTTLELDEIGESALMEIGNILSGAYLNAFYSFTGISMLPSVPALTFDMAGAILNVVLVQLGEMGDHALLLETNFEAENDEIGGQFFLVPDPGALDTIMREVGVE